MNNRERFQRIMRFEPVDRVPNFELNLWQQTLDRWLEEGLPRNAVPCRAIMWGNEYLGIDRRDPVDVKLSMIPPFDEEIIEETERHRIYRDPEGRVRKALKVGESHGYRLSMDQYLSFPVKDRDDFRTLKKRYDPRSSSRYLADWSEKVGRWQERDYPVMLPDTGAMGFYWYLREWMGTINASYAFYDDPHLVHEMMDFIADFTIETLHRALDEVEIDCFSFAEDFAYKTGPLISPELFRRFFLPRYRRVTDFLRAHGVDSIWLDTDGNFEVLIPLMLEVGITCVWPLEVTAGMDPVALRKEYGTDLVLSGGIDKRKLAEGKKEIEQELISKLPYLLEQGGYIPTLDHSVPPNISLENYRYYLELKSQFLKGSFGA